jgi:hypothetical protein
MTWTADELREIGTALLGSWPGTMAAWGREAVAAYIAELQARGLAAEGVLTAIRTWPAGSDFPPSAPNLAAAARRDPSQPTFDEALVLIQRALRAWNSPLRGDFANEAEMLKARERHVIGSAQGVHPLAAAFIHRRGIRQLQKEIAELGDEEYGSLRRRDLQQAWEAHLEAFEGREISALVAGRRDGLRQLDPLAALGITAPSGQLEPGTPTEGA